MARISDPTSTSERIPPRLSTDSFDSLTCAGTNFSAMKKATTATGITTKKMEFQAKRVSSSPESSGPQALMAPPTAAHSAIDLVLAGPVHRAAISARQVGKAMPAAMPPKIRAPIRISMVGAKAASSAAGMASTTPVSSSSLRP